MIPMRELSDKELDVVCGGFISHQRPRATNVAVVISSRNILVVQTIAIKSKTRSRSLSFLKAEKSCACIPKDDGQRTVLLLRRTKEASNAFSGEV